MSRAVGIDYWVVVVVVVVSFRPVSLLLQAMSTDAVTIGTWEGEGSTTLLYYKEATMKMMLVEDVDKDDGDGDGDDDGKSSTLRPC